MTWRERVFGSSRRITVKSPLIIRSPRIGFLNLLGEPAQSMLEEDKAALGPLFSGLAVSDASPPVCDVLLIYARVEDDGRIAGTADGLRDLIKAGGPIAIVATANASKSLIAAGKSADYGQANLVLTLNRKGTAFARFFSELFGKMFRGTTMPLAWVELAPQTSAARHDNCPYALFLAEISHILFQTA